MVLCCKGVPRRIACMSSACHVWCLCLSVMLCCVIIYVIMSHLVLVLLASGAWTRQHSRLALAAVGLLACQPNLELCSTSTARMYSLKPDTRRSRRRLLSRRCDACRVEAQQSHLERPTLLVTVMQPHPTVSSVASMLVHHCGSACHAVHALCSWTPCQHAWYRQDR